MCDLRDTLDLNFSFEVDRRNNLTYEEFDNEYRKQRRPVVITGLLNRWPAMRKWTPEYFREALGSKTILRKGKSLNIGELFESFDNVPPGERPRYINSIMLRRQFQELASDILPEIPHLWPNRLCSRWMAAVSELVDREGCPELLLAGKNASFALHYDNSSMMGFITQIYGTKDLIVFPPSQSGFLYQRKESSARNLSLIEDVFEPDFERFPLLKKAKAALVTIGPGDVLFHPPGWWHTSQTREISIAMVISTVGAQNWKEFCEDAMNLSAPSVWWKRLLKRTYVPCAGALMSLEDSLAGIRRRSAKPRRRERRLRVDRAPLIE